jgi:Uma2 family endonuclease
MSSGHPIVRRFTADEAIRMVDAGILDTDERLELLDGVLVEMSPKGHKHVVATTRIAKQLRGVYANTAEVLEEKPLRTSPLDLPEPDVSVVRGRIEDYSDVPTGSAAILVVEVCWSSQRNDRVKASTYAEGGVEVYWLLDLAARKLELRTMPVDGVYQVTRVLDEDDVVELPEARSNVRWTVRDLLP